MYVDNGFEDQAAKVVIEQLRYKINGVRNAVRVGKSQPSLWPQAAVRKAGVELQGQIALAGAILGAMGRQLSDENVVLAQQAAHSAVSFRYNAA